MILLVLLFVLLHSKNFTSHTKFSSINQITCDGMAWHGTRQGQKPCTTVALGAGLLEILVFHNKTIWPVHVTFYSGCSDDDNATYAYCCTPPSACRCWGCCVPVWCCAGGGTTRPMSYWSPEQPTHEEDTGLARTKGSTNKNKEKKPQLTCPQFVVFSSSKLKHTLHRITIGYTLVIWGGGGSVKIIIY